MVDSFIQIAAEDADIPIDYAEKIINSYLQSIIMCCVVSGSVKTPLGIISTNENGELSILETNESIQHMIREPMGEDDIRRFIEGVLSGENYT